MLGVLVPTGPTPPPPPEALPLGRAALAVGVPVIFGDQVADGLLVGLRPEPGRWVPARGRPAAVWDRFPGQGRRAAWLAALAGLGGVPVGNPPALDALCRDKLACQRALPGFPEVEDDPARFPAALAAWGAGFLKPRFGAFGVGVARVVPGDPLPAVVDGLHGPEPALLQRAVPPRGPVFVSVRVLVQREGERFVAAEPAARWSADDPVVNAARGARVAPLAALHPELDGPVRRTSEALAEALAESHEPLLELGVDLVPGPGGAWPVEINGKPRGRLEALAADDARYAEARELAALRPLLHLRDRYL